MVLFHLGLLLCFLNFGPLNKSLSLLNHYQPQIGNQLYKLAATTFVLHTCSSNTHHLISLVP